MMRMVTVVIVGVVAILLVGSALEREHAIGMH